MPAPGGNFAGAPTASRGYAGPAGGPPATSGPGGAGGVRNTSSGTRQASTSASVGGSRSSSPGGSQNQGSGNNMGRGDTPSSGRANGGLGSSGGPGGSQNQGGPSNASRAAAAQAANNRANARTSPSGGPNNASRAAAAAAARSRQPAGNYMSGRSAESRAAQLQAVTRGPGVTQGTRPGGLSTPQAAQRTATSLGLSRAEMFGLDPNRTVAAMNQIARTIAGETAGLPAAQQAAAARALVNRMAVAQAGIINDKQYTTDPVGSLYGFDASGIRPGTERNAAYNAAAPGTPSHADALAAIASSQSPYGNLANVPSAIQNATHYLNKEATLKTEGRLPSWAAAANNQFGPHSFGNPDVKAGATAEAVEAARNAAFGGPGGFGTLGPSTPANPNMPALAGLDPTRATPMSAIENARLPGSLSGTFRSRSPAAAGPPAYAGAGMAAFGLAPSQTGMTQPASMVAGMPDIPGPTGFPAAQPNMNMAGYQSPMAGVRGVPKAPLASQGPGLLASPNINLGRQPPDPAGMDMSGYRSPITGLTGMPPASSNMNMSGYRSPMEGLTGMLPAQGNMNMAGYNSPMAGLTGMPPAPGRMDMAGYTSPMGGVTGLAGPSYDPLSSITAPSPTQDGMETAQPEEDFMEREAEYDPLSSIRTRAPTTVAEEQLSGGLWGVPEQAPYQYGKKPGAPKPGTYGPQEYMNPVYSFSVPGRPKGTRRDSVAPRGTQTALTTALGMGTGVPGMGLATDALQALGARARQGRVGNNPGGPYTEGMDHSQNYEGGSGSNRNSYPSGTRSRSNNREKDRENEEGSGSGQSAPLPWEGAAPFPFAPPQLVQRGHPRFQWGNWT